MFLACELTEKETNNDRFRDGKVVCCYATPGQRTRKLLVPSFFVSFFVVFSLLLCLRDETQGAGQFSSFSLPVSYNGSTKATEIVLSLALYIFLREEPRFRLDDKTQGKEHL